MIKKIHLLLKKYGAGRRLVRQRSRVAHILACLEESRITRSEQDFVTLQSRYPPRPEYGYDPLNIFKRASERAVSVLQQPGIGLPGLKGLDLGAGDGMLSVLLETFGHHMTLSDLEDWRVSAAKGLTLVVADCCDHLPMPDGTFDFVASFNSFEHFSNPERAMEEVLRVTRPGGIVYLHFGPLYCGPWGLHAYRTLRMPYPQFLFSDAFIDRRLGELGIWDLGKKRQELQTLNKWKPAQFKMLWTRPEIEVLSEQWHINEEHIDLVLEYPECFSGRGLVFDDLVRDSVMVTLRKR